MQDTNAPETPDGTVYLHYDTAFPQLNGAPSTSSTNGHGKAKPKTVKSSFVKSDRVKEFIEIPCSERANTFPGKKGNSLSHLASELSKQYQVEVDINSSKSQSLTIVITGTAENVASAKCAVVRSLQTQAKLELHIDPKYHRFLIGRGGSTLTNLERETTTKINVPSNKIHSDTVTITGPKHGCDAARRKIMSIVDTQSKLSSERLSIPKIFHPFIKGPRRENIIRWTETHKVRIDIAPPSSEADDICVSGDKQKVDMVVAEMNKIYKTHEKQAKRCVINVPKSQHRLVFGPKGSGLDMILESTGVSVELPQNESDEVVLYGPPTKMGTAMSIVIERATSSVREELVAPNRFHKVLIGKSGSALAALLEGYQERVRVEFGSQTDRIELDGPAEDVMAVKARLQKRLEELKQTMAIETIKIPSKYHGMVVGSGGGNIRRIREKYNCQISLNQKLNETTEITVEGDTKNIGQAVKEIREFVTRLENEKTRDLIIEPDIQIMLRTTSAGTKPVKALYEEFPKVSFHWPVPLEGIKNNTSASDPSNSVCQISGQRQEVDACAEKLIKLVKQVKESNYHHDFRVYKEFRPTFFARDNNKVRAILNELQCRLQTPPAGSDSSAPSGDKSSDLFWIVGREKQVHQAVDKIDALQRLIMNMKEVRLPIPPFVLTKAVGNEAPRLRSIKEQCDGVSFKFPRSSPEASASTAKEIIVYGPSEAVTKAQKLIEELNNKVAELCDEVVVPCDKKFHGMLIGRSGQNIAAFREKHHVELVFPDRYEINPSLANEIHVLGSKANVASAKMELMKQISALEDEDEFILMVPQELVRNVRQAHAKLQERVRMNIVRPGGKKSSPRAEEELVPADNSSDVEIKFTGPKAMVETTRQVLTLLVNDLQKYSKEPPREFPIKDKFHARIIGRMRNQLPDLESEYRVIIKVQLPTRDQLEAIQATPIGTLDVDQATIGTVSIYGNPEQIDSVWEEGFRPCLPINQKFDLEKDLHRYLVMSPDSPKRTGNSSSVKKEPVANKVSELQSNHGVYIKLPPINQQNTDYIVLYGTPPQIQAAEDQLRQWVKEWEVDKADRIARSYEETVDLKECFIPFIMAHKADKWRNEHSVQFRTQRSDAKKRNNQSEDKSNGSTEKEEIEENNDAQGDEHEHDEPLYPPDVSLLLLSERQQKVTLRGYKEKVALVRTELEALLKELEEQERVVLNIPQMVHSQLIGAKRLKQLKLQKDFGVQIEFPDRNARGDSAHIVVVMGPPSKVDEACHSIISTAQELIERHENKPNGPTMSERKGDVINFNGMLNGKAEKNKANVVITGAPWSEKDKK